MRNLGFRGVGVRVSGRFSVSFENGALRHRPAYVFPRLYSTQHSTIENLNLPKPEALNLNHYGLPEASFCQGFVRERKHGVYFVV